MVLDFLWHHILVRCIHFELLTKITRGTTNLVDNQTAEKQEITQNPENQTMHLFPTADFITSLKFMKDIFTPAATTPTILK